MDDIKRFCTRIPRPGPQFGGRCSGVVCDAVILTIVDNSIVRKSIELGFARVRNASGDGVRGLES